jgi:hypothetical protein
MFVWPENVKHFLALKKHRLFEDNTIRGDAGAVKRDSLKSYWLSAFIGSIPIPRIIIGMESKTSSSSKPS